MRRAKVAARGPQVARVAYRTADAELAAGTTGTLSLRSDHGRQRPKRAADADHICAAAALSDAREHRGVCEGLIRTLR